MKCETCKKELTGQQRKYCCLKCKNKNGNLKYQAYQAQQAKGLNRKKYFIEKLGGKCNICGYKKNIAGLTFHHLDPSIKEMEINIRQMSNNSMKTLTKEVEKCQLLCHNCHMEVHYPYLEMVGPEGLEPPTNKL
jgi:hypothetical protein